MVYENNPHMGRNSSPNKSPKQPAVFSSAVFVLPFIFNCRKSDTQEIEKASPRCCILGAWKGNCFQWRIKVNSFEKMAISTLITRYAGNVPYLEDHPRYRKWLGSAPFISHEVPPFGRGTTPVRGLPTTMVANHLLNEMILHVPEMCHLPRVRTPTGKYLGEKSRHVGMWTKSKKVLLEGFHVSVFSEW